MAAKSDEKGEDAAFSAFLSEVKQIEKRDSVLTGTQQIDRLLRKGAKYANLNPYEVLLIDPEISPEDLRKAYRKLSFLVHPDKNHDDKERAQIAFEAVNKAYKTLEDPEQLEYCKSIWEEAVATTDQKLREKRAENKKRGIKFIDEDKNPELKKEMIRKTMTKLFVDYDIRKKQLEERETTEKKRFKEMEDEEKDKIKRVKEYEQEWAASRVERVTSWRDFQNKGPKKAKKTHSYKPPKFKQETRS
ncbi:PREDICTED: dnaJ homolog subfamily C member 8-like [Amphimedon queenslandica]|uniref:J domain-containing protein n=1 Tax=Amphimedon queenslandica TaxID=400682 RepID=A0A1X7VJE9_AMPQE|nr:PREDICTED: dnaJ homolog subfamily C member 8-like [Amphimedon queenslandica]|eukprot:XP_003384077.1 PREDICTED: dnaJ homolog subfamily C member 8-like [Amphimedon queenslandica]